MYPRFGLAYTAIYAAQARAHAAQMQQQDYQSARAVAVPKRHDAEIGALWRMGGVMAAIVMLAGTVVWFAA